MKTFSCGDVVSGCDMVFRGIGDDGIIERACEHAKEVHGVNPDHDFIGKVNAKIAPFA